MEMAVVLFVKTKFKGEILCQKLKTIILVK